MFEKYCEGTPIFVIIDVRMGVEGLPTIAYQPSNEITVDGSSAGVVQRVFKHIPVSIQAEEAEAVNFLFLVPFLLFLSLILLIYFLGWCRAFIT